MKVEKDICQYDAWQQLKIFQKALQIDNSSTEDVEKHSAKTIPRKLKNIKKHEAFEDISDDKNVASDEVPPLVTISYHGVSIDEGRAQSGIFLSHLDFIRAKTM